MSETTTLCPRCGATTWQQGVLSCPDPWHDIGLAKEFHRLVYAMAGLTVVNIAAVVLTWAGIR